ncbi:peptidoglycan-binding protein [Pedobacter psychroterrae]|uniref:Peptidoglycan-binding protein n=2 Tax=Pedobacter psychroterrae TaxID=2530453 RepID=A0A4R0NWI9_9SPHI|nr:peptidoglycan-binding protein [Pedobacter psychroterrae]
MYQQSSTFFKPKVYSKLVALAQGELWVREKTGNNDGERVEGYLASVGLEKGQPWCAAFVSFIFKQAGYSAPRTGWSPSLFPLQRLVKAAAPGNVFGIYFPALKRISHCGFVERKDGDWITSIEGNTGIGGGRDGDGVYRRKRHKRTIYKYADWEKKL